MYCLTRKNDQFCLVKSDLEIGSDTLVKSMLSPKWYGSTWQLPHKTEKKTWMNFIAKGLSDDPRLNRQIVHSWRRCQLAEVDPIKGGCEKIIPVNRIESRSEQLLALAKPIMDTLYHCLQGSEFVIVLIDREGYLLKIIGGLKELKQADRIRFGPGANWAEGCVGTNAIGTALALGHPVQVTGAEHYCESHHLWTCSAAPIRKQDGEIIGFLDISGPRERATVHQLGLIVAAAHAIEDRIVLNESYCQIYDVNKYLEAILNSVSDGIVAVNGQGLITGINKVAARGLQCNPAELVGKSINAFTQHRGRLQSFFNSKAAGRSEEEISLKMPGGKRTYTAKACPVFNEKNDNKGFVLTFSPTPKTISSPHSSKGMVTKFSFFDIIGESSLIRQSIEKAKRVAQGPSTVLILGESGTGKELFAQAIHNASDCKFGPFVSVNCGAIPRELIQSELFGYEEGSFTGAKRGGRAGKFVTANGGTLFLDEIGEMPLEMQINLLRVLEEEAVVPVGGRRAIPINVRIIAATNRSLFEEVSKGRFREDLYYRLNVISIALPPLRAREGDIDLLVNYFVKKISRKVGKNIHAVDPDVIRMFEKYNWPGNIRELANAVEYAVNIAPDEEILVKHLPTYLRKNQFEKPRPGADGIMTLSALEKDAIEKTLLFYSGNITKASKALGIGRNTLYEKIKKYGLGG
jgi:sigma-54 dependent transcriptional regulator, acetoin dehydrogenase operon transcriptional activator AcoR